MLSYWAASRGSLSQKKFLPLANRINIVVSSTLDSVPEGVYLANDFNRALTICECLHSNNKVDEVFVIGGTRLYEAALNQSEYPVRFYCTHVLKDYECDVFFPDIDWKSFKEITLPTVEPGIKHCGDVDIRFAVYEKALK
uniref:dihydrofolate reductase n=1 Tax=Schistocephalus solidus TaxID=70667 RepID=A0A0X3NP13_SCHSO